MKGYEQVSIQNRPCAIIYKGEHYAIRNTNTGRTTRIAKAAIIKKFHLHHDALDRYVAGGFKKCYCNANEDVVRVNYVESVTFLVTSLVVMVPQVFLILAVLLGFIDGRTQFIEILR